MIYHIYTCLLERYKCQRPTAKGRLGSASFNDCVPLATRAFKIVILSVEEITKKKIQYFPETKDELTLYRL